MTGLTIGVYPSRFRAEHVDSDALAVARLSEQPAHPESAASMIPLASSWIRFRWSRPLKLSA
jgi:hypothetical protein